MVNGITRVRKELEIKNNVIFRWDIKWNKWNKCGIIKKIQNNLVYVTRKREVLRMYGAHGSLGVSNDILEFLWKLNPIPSIIVEFGKEKPYKHYRTSITKLLTMGKPFSFKNEQDLTYHLPIECWEELK